jgi:hypothetical protein
MNPLEYDPRAALRTLTHARADAAAVVAMIALGVSAGAILVTVYKGALLDPWPCEGGDRLLVFRGDYPVVPRHPALWSAAEVADLHGFDAVFDHVIAGQGRDVNLAGLDGAERVRGAALTPNAFAMLGIHPRLGRVLDAGDAGPGAEPVVVIGHGLWQRRCGGDPGVVGTTLPIDDVPHVIAGVMPPRFLWWGSELWLPLRIDETGADRDVRPYVVQARLRRGVDIRQASAVLDASARRVERDHVSAHPFYEGWQAGTQLLVEAVGGNPGGRERRTPAARRRPAGVARHGDHRRGPATVGLRRRPARGGGRRGRRGAGRGRRTARSSGRRPGFRARPRDQHAACRCPRIAYHDRASLQRFALDLQARLAMLPEAEDAGLGIAAPLGGGPIHPVALRTRPELAGAESRYEIVAGHWFAALGARRIAGRLFDERDARMPNAWPW